MVALGGQWLCCGGGRALRGVGYVVRGASRWRSRFSQAAPHHSPPALAAYRTQTVVAPTPRIERLLCTFRLLAKWQRSCARAEWGGTGVVGIVFVVAVIRLHCKLEAR